MYQIKKRINNVAIIHSKKKTTIIIIGKTLLSAKIFLNLFFNFNSKKTVSKNVIHNAIADFKATDEDII